jgi:hypothetical protein
VDGAEITVILNSSSGDVERIFSLGPVPIRERTALNVPGIGLICLAHRVGTEEGNAPLHDRLVFFWSSCLAIVGCEFRKIRPSNDFRKAAGRVERQLTLRVWTIEIGLLAVLLPRLSLMHLADSANWRPPR